MYTLAQTEPLESCEDTVYIVAAPWLEEEYINAGYQRHERSYKIIYQHNQYTVLCPEYRSCEPGVSSIVIIPVFLIPRRPYPVQIYLYAIDLYSSNPGMGQREAAEITRKQFGLQHFAHTTLGRALKAFVSTINEASEYRDDEIHEPDEEGAQQHTGGEQRDEAEQKNSEGKQTGFPTTQSTAKKRKQAARVLEWKINWTTPKQFIEACFEFAKDWFNRFCRFLL
jgi:hypothetical protein